jgi:hypothetical protein
MPTRRYWLDGVLLESDIELHAAPEVRTDDGAAPTLHLRLHLRLRSVDASSVTEWEERASGATFGGDARGYFLRYGDLVSFSFDGAGEEIACDIGRMPLGSVEQLVLDQVLPLVLHLRGRFSFHASAVAEGAGAVAFLGDSGRGKSTLASSLANEGRLLVCDDCLAVSIDDGRAHAFPSYASTRLWPPSADALFAHRGPLPRATPRTDKRRVELAQSRDATDLLRIYLLEEAESGVAIERLSRAAAIGKLVKHVFRLVGVDRDLLMRELAFLERLVSVVPVSTLAYPRRYAELASVREAIRADLGAGGE